MIAILYTDTDKVRSALGVDDTDLTDAGITDRNLEAELNLDLSDWVADHATVYADSTFKANALELYCTYFCARRLVSALQLAAMQKAKKSEDEMVRFDADWKALSDYLDGQLNKFKKKVQELVLSDTGATSGLNLFSGVGLATDPITG